MKALKRLTVIMTVVAMIAVFVGCGKKDSIVGTWECDNYTFVFEKDGTGTETLGGINVEISSYSITKDKLSITVSFLGTEETDEYTYTLKKNTLTLDDGSSTWEFTRK